jgi:hypothetical protein
MHCVLFLLFACETVCCRLKAVCLCLCGVGLCVLAGAVLRDGRWVLWI